MIEKSRKVTVRFTPREYERYTAFMAESRGSRTWTRFIHNALQEMTRLFDFQAEPANGKKGRKVKK